MMKKLLTILAALCTLLCTSCGGENGKEQENLSSNLIGKWELVDAKLATKSAVIGSVTVSVTLEFLADGSFAISQTLGEGRAKEYSGTWTLVEDVLSGKYSDNKNWGSSYKVEIDGASLSLTTQPDEKDCYIYMKKQ